MDARQSRRGKRISLQQEKRVAADLGGRTMAASGATRLGGGADVRVLGKTRIECKFTESDNYILKFAELEKLKKQANKSLEYPVFQFAFRETSGRLTQYAVIPWSEGDGPKIVLETETKSWPFDKHYIQELTRGASLVQVIFHAREGNSLRSRYYRIMAWDDFLERHNADA